MKLGLVRIVMMHKTNITIFKITQCCLTGDQENLPRGFPGSWLFWPSVPLQVEPYILIAIIFFYHNFEPRWLPLLDLLCAHLPICFCLACGCGWLWFEILYLNKMVSVNCIPVHWETCGEIQFDSIYFVLKISVLKGEV